VPGVTDSTWTELADDATEHHMQVYVA